jgi:hypothetical protein
VQYWDSDCGEGHLMQGNREFLAQEIALLSPEQLAQLATIDKQAKNLLARYQGSETIDVWNLRNVVHLIDSARLNIAA